MKQFKHRVMGGLLAAVLLLSVFTGCKNKQETEDPTVTLPYIETTDGEKNTSDENTESEETEETSEEDSISSEDAEILASLKAKYLKLFLVTDSDSLNVREEPNTNAAIVGTMKMYSGGSVLSEEPGGEWLYVESGEVRGYVFLPLVKTGEEAETLAVSHAVKSVRVAADSANIRKEPYADAAIVQKAANGTVFEVLAEENGFSEIELADGTIAYISNSIVENEYSLREAEANEEETSEESSEEESSEEQQGTNGFTVCIDPGHQQHGISELEPDGPGSTVMKAKLATGTQGCVTGVPEYQVNLDVSLKLKEILELRGYRVVMIRTTNDCPQSNAERALVANSSGADIFVRVHCNSLEDTSVTGIINYVPSGANPYLSPEVISASNRLGKELADKMCAATGAQNRGVLASDSMSGINWCTLPVTILEMGFMSNPDEDRLLVDPGYQNVMATGIANGIDAYFER